MIKYFKLADIIIRVKDPLNIPLSDAEKDFLIKGDKFDYDFEFIECESFEDIINQGTLIYNKNKYRHGMGWCDCRRIFSI